MDEVQPKNLIGSANINASNGHKTIAKVTYTEGLVVAMDDMVNIRLLQPGSVVYLHDKVFTGDNSYLIMTDDAGSPMLVQPNNNITLQAEKFAAYPTMQQVTTNEQELNPSLLELFAQKQAIAEELRGTLSESIDNNLLYVDHGSFMQVPVTLIQTQFAAQPLDPYDYQNTIFPLSLALFEVINPQSPDEVIVFNEGDGGTGDVFMPINQSGNLLTNDNLSASDLESLIINDIHYDGHLGAANKVIDEPNGTITFTAEDGSWQMVFVTSGEALGDFTFTQTAALYHSGVNDEVISGKFDYSYQTNNTTANSTITIHIVDDKPVARNDFAQVASGETIMGDVLLNDHISVDGNLGVIHLDSGEVGQLVNGEFGQLTLNMDGSYQYNADIAGSGIEVFHYTIIDGDGDRSTAELRIQVGDDYENVVAANQTDNIDNITNTAFEQAGSALSYDDLIDDGMQNLLVQFNLTEYGSTNVDNVDNVNSVASSSAMLSSLFSGSSFTDLGLSSFNQGLQVTENQTDVVV